MVKFIGGSYSSVFMRRVCETEVRVLECGKESVWLARLGSDFGLGMAQSKFSRTCRSVPVDRGISFGRPQHSRHYLAL